MKIDDKTVVSIHYKLTNDKGDVLDSSEGKDPLVYLHGTHSLIDGLESELKGKVAGDKFDVTVQPEDGYGVVNPELVKEVPHSAFQGVDDIQPGMQFEAKSSEGHLQLITIEEVKEESVRVNANHPLAGEILHFNVSVEEVRVATVEELEHGHAHGPGEHSH